MAEIVDWARNLLTSRGALVETEEAGALRALLSPELAGALDASDWLSLRFGAGASSDDESEWLERFGRLLPPDARVTGARLRHPKMIPPVDSRETTGSRSGHSKRHLPFARGLSGDGPLLLFQLSVHHGIGRDEPGRLDGLSECDRPLSGEPAGIAAQGGVGRFGGRS